MGVASDHDVWRAAVALIERFGEHAPLYARQSVDLCIERSDAGGAAAWRRVWRATEALLRYRAGVPDTGVTDTATLADRPVTEAGYSARACVTPFSIVSACWRCSEVRSVS